MTNTAKKLSKHQLDTASFALTAGVKAIEKYGRSYMTYDQVGNNWRTEIPYSFGAEEDLILWAKTFINNMHSDNLRYLGTLVKEISKFLAVYTSRKYTTTEKDGRPVIEYEADALKKHIWKECTHIAQLRKTQHKNNLKAKMSDDKKRAVEKREAKQQKAATKKYNSTITHQIQALFAEARTYREM